ncbi:Retrotransposon gag protein [Abeliophyllum distichum]|uniref:Retrotransposon gag protein n=1 Tax=Abeliophyllum distichum TaxID=126358 RepID=A0ABD1SZB4_9LAMI
MEKYDGSSDPIDHLRSFVDLMRLQATPDVIMCRAFPPTLRREARDWVVTLPAKSIHTFDEFSKNFATQFTNSKRVKKTAISLMQLAQGKDELLKDFIARFNRATLGIKELQMSTVVTAMMSGTGNRQFKMSLSKNPLNTMHELLRKSEKYVDSEKTYLITKGDEPMFKNHGDEPLSEKQGHEPMFKNQGHEPMFKNQGHEPMSKIQGDEPLSKKQGDEPMFSRP